MLLVGPEAEEFDAILRMAISQFSATAHAALGMAFPRERICVSPRDYGRRSNDYAIIAGPVTRTSADKRASKSSEGGVAPAAIQAPEPAAIEARR